MLLLAFPCSIQIKRSTMFPEYFAWIDGRSYHWRIPSQLLLSISSEYHKQSGPMSVRLPCVLHRKPVGLFGQLSIKNISLADFATTRETNSIRERGSSRLKSLGRDASPFITISLCWRGFNEIHSRKIFKTSFMKVPLARRSTSLPKIMAPKLFELFSDGVGLAVI